MHEFVIKNHKQLDICLRMLYAEKVRFVVNLFETKNKKMMYSVTVDVDDQTMYRLEEKYRIYTS